MKLIAALSPILQLVLVSPLVAHGGSYTNRPYAGPGDLVPAPTRPNSTNPTTPSAPSTPTTPDTPAVPAAPGTGPIPVTPPALTGPAVPAAGTAAGGAVTGGGLPLGPDDTTWDIWWRFNRGSFLDLRRRIAYGGVLTEVSGPTAGLEGFLATGGDLPTRAQILQVVRPALIRSLEIDASRDILSADLIALARVGREVGSRARILGFLSHSKQEVAESAALSLGILQDIRSLPALEDLARDSKAGRSLTGDQTEVPTRTRVFAVYGMGLLGRAAPQQLFRETVAGKLLDLLESDEAAYSDLRVACVLSLGLLSLDRPEPVVDRLRAYLAEDRNDRLARAHCPNTIARLLRGRAAASDSPLPGVVVGELSKLMRSQRTPAELRRSCVQALGLLTPADAPWATDVVALLVRHKEGGRDRLSRNLTAIALAEIAATKPGPIRDRILEGLEESVRKGSTQYRPWAAIGVGVFGHRLHQGGAAIPAFLEVAVAERFRDPANALERSAYAISLGLLQARDEGRTIWRVLEDTRDPAFRGYACVALGLLGAWDHRDGMLRLLRESRRHPELQQRVAIGLGLLGDKEAAAVLLELLAPEQGRPPLSVLASTATALGFIGDYRSVDPLVEILDGRDSQLKIGRAFAAVSLGMVGDKELLPWVTAISEGVNYSATVGTLYDPIYARGILDIL